MDWRVTATTVLKAQVQKGDDSVPVVGKDVDRREAS